MRRACAAPSARVSSRAIVAASRAGSGPRASRIPLVERHRDVGPPIVGLADLMHGADVGVRERARRAGLGEEALGRTRPGNRVGRKNLERNVAVEALVVCAVDDAHPAAPEQRDDTEAAREAADHGIRRVPIRLKRG